MEKLFFFILTFSFLSCRDNLEQSVAPATMPLNFNNNYEAIILKEWNKEYLHYDSTLINGSIPIITSSKMIYNLLGVPDKIVPMLVNRNNFPFIAKSKPKDACYLIYGNTVFEKYGDNVVVNTIDFESTKIELVNTKITLKKGIRPIEIQRAFPESGRLIGGSGNTWSGNIMISASKPNGGINDVWFLIFKNEQLCRVVLYTIPGLENLN
ncbi:MAG: hypothetical protein Q7T20_03685 [Saprospiraceae bacterium]|nr:hypothetical protein [Saprospiraceae bacterium]